MLECNSDYMKIDDKRLNEISKYISLILRHKPEEIGISLDEHGWANVEELIKGIGINFETLQTIVNADEKSRYSFNNDKTKIRANQGHSISVDVELEEKEPPDFLFHGTAKKFMRSINENGLIPKSRLYVHLTDDIDMAKKVGVRHGELIIYRIDAKKMADTGIKFYKSVNNVWLTKKVDKQYLVQI